MNTSLFVAERRRAILEQLKRQGRVSVQELSETMQVSAVTIRQDLRNLEQEGLLERTYGGAVSPQQDANQLELSFDVRRSKNRHEKACIGAFAASLVQEGDSVALDASTSAYAIVPYLKHFKRLTIVTNSLVIAQRFLDRPEVTVLIPGGRMRPDSISTVGQPETLPEINMNIGFFGAKGITPEIGINDFDPDEVAMKRAMIARCIRPVIVVDSQKWGQIAPYPFQTCEETKHIITTENAPAEMVDAFRQKGIIVDIAPTTKSP